MSKYFKKMCCRALRHLNELRSEVTKLLAAKHISGTSSTSSPPLQPSPSSSCLHCSQLVSEVLSIKEQLAKMSSTLLVLNSSLPSPAQNPSTRAPAQQTASTDPSSLQTFTPAAVNLPLYRSNPSLVQPQCALLPCPRLQLPLPLLPPEFNPSMPPPSKQMPQQLPRLPVTEQRPRAWQMPEGALQPPVPLMSLQLPFPWRSRSRPRHRPLRVSNQRNSLFQHLSGQVDTSPILSNLASLN